MPDDPTPPAGARIEARAAVVRRGLDVPMDYRLAFRAAVAEAEPSVADEDVFTWESQAAQYPPAGAPGIGYFRGDLDPERWVNCLLYHDDDGSLVGILNHFPVEIPPHERRGSLGVWVRPDRQGRGIGTELVLDAMARGWEVDPFALKLSRRGLALTRTVANLLQPRPGDPGAPPDGDPPTHPGR